MKNAKLFSLISVIAVATTLASLLPSEPFAGFIILGAVLAIGYLVEHMA